ncbi:MAG: DUF2497 domain-containing protein [Alphaproteobacteria bacterium]|nr:DUF2497 domain-containing protein [Alphaproteobacteria bacterium]
MTPKRDHEDEMSMEEILASIRKFVTDNPPEDSNKQKCYKRDLSQSVVPPATDLPHSHNTSAIQAEREVRPQVATVTKDSFTPPIFDLQNETRSHASQVNHQHQGAVPLYDHDILELKSPLSSGHSPQQTSQHQSAWTPPSRTQLGKKVLEESIMTLTNPIDTKKAEKSLRSPLKGSYSIEGEETLGSTQVMAASASSLMRLAQASKSIPKKSPSLADQRNVTLDQLIQDLIRPMIKQWIDTHLPSLVEEMVAKEIKRITKHLG